VPFSPSQQPRLTWWSHTWRTLLVLLVSGSAVTTMAEDERPVVGLLVALDLALGVVAFVLVFFRRRWPVPVAVATTLASAVSGTAAGPALLALVSLATRRRWREIVPVALLGLLSGVAYALTWPGAVIAGGGTWDVVFQAGIGVPFTGAIVAWGLYVGSRRELLWTLRDRAQRAEEEQAGRVAQARTAERTRIAREMHDVLAHRISLVTMHADAMVYRKDLDVEQLRTSAEVIQESSHRALVELREVLGVLRDDPGDAVPERPQPSAADVPALVDELVADGMRLRVDLDGTDLSAVPDTAGRTLYRVVQEALTNARKHAPNALVALTVRGRPGQGLDVEVRNPLGPGERTSAPHSGLGLVGLAERVALVGGRIDHRSTDGHFVLAAWLPWPVPG
jgi:signal transduction histidine kinase